MHLPSGFLKRLVRKVSAWAWREETAVKEGIARLQELHMTPNGMESEIKLKPELSQYVAQCFAELVAQSPNYTELNFDLVAGHEEDYKWITVTVQKGNGKTPHALRMEAEQKLAIAESRIRSMTEGDKHGS